MSTAIEFNHVGKQYRLGLVSTKTLSHDLNRWWQTAILKKEDPYLKIGETNDRAVAGSSDYVWALRDIDFKVEQGDVVGIIGKNGAGKSTLLKLLSKVTGPTTGSIRARGRIGSLLEVGTGFHPEMTGRENIYMNGAIMGMTKAEIARKLDEIVDFSGCERYIDTPVKRYSSGMTVRLGFAVAAHLDPEILVVDEVLAVGDAEFQKKAIGKMQDVSKGEGRTVLFVSHNMGSVQQLCHTGILLDKGMIKYTGGISDVIREYQIGDNFGAEFVGEDGDANGLQLLSASVRPEYGDMIYNTSNIDIEFTVSVNKRIPALVAGFNIMSQYGAPLMRADFNDLSRINTLELGIHKFHFRIPKCSLSNGKYYIVFDVADKDEKCYTTEKSHLMFEVFIDEEHPVNAYNEENQIKASIVRNIQLVDYC